MQKIYYVPMVSNCQICSKSLVVKPSHAKLGWGKYCSISCRTKSQLRGKQVPCYLCGRSIYRSLRMIQRSKSGNHFCSKSCQTLWRNSLYSGENHVNWINGISAYRKLLQRSGRKEFCQLCGITEKRILSAHHIDHKRSNNKVENLTWLCFNCHYLVHHDSELDLKVRKYSQPN